MTSFSFYGCERKKAEKKLLHLNEVEVIEVLIHHVIFKPTSTNMLSHYMLRLLRVQPQKNQTFICVFDYSLKLDHVRFWLRLDEQFWFIFCFEQSVQLRETYAWRQALTRSEPTGNSFKRQTLFFVIWSQI